MLGFERDLHRVLDLGRRLGPDLDFFLTTLAVGDHAAAELLLDLVGLFLVPIEDRLLVDRRLDVVDRDRQTRLRGVPEAQALHTIEAVRNDRHAGHAKGHRPQRIVVV